MVNSQQSSSLPVYNLVEGGSVQRLNNSSALISVAIGYQHCVKVVALGVVVLLPIMDLLSKWLCSFLTVVTTIFQHRISICVTH